MSKCIETFAHYCDDDGIISEQYKEEIVEVWQSAWNAAIEHAAKVCDAAAFSSPEPTRYMECAEAIRKETTNP